MSTVLNAGNIGMSPTIADELNLVEPPDAEHDYQFLKDRDITPDLRHRCPICGDLYHPGDGVLALGCLPFPTGEPSASPEPSGCEPGNSILLGHPDCVLPRLFTLLASFRPDERFVRAVSAGETALREFAQDQP